MERILLLVNTGTPDNADISSVKRYLKEFLNDPMVIDLPWLVRKILVNFIIVPSRSTKSSGLYKRLWTSEGSPLKINLEKLACRMQLKLSGKYRVIGAMRYGNPSIRAALQSLTNETELTVIPLYPQYASATTGSVKEAILREVRSLNNIRNTKFIGQFYSHPAFVKVFSERIRTCEPFNFDHIVFSYHSLPESQIKKIHPAILPQSCTCDKAFPEHGFCCYKASCHMTTRLLVKELGLKEGHYTTSFQSRMSKNWIGPFTDKVLTDLARAGKSKVLIASPSFVSDCLETIIELKEDYKKLFISAGGKELVLVESLNSGHDWVDALCEIMEHPEG